MKIAILSKGTGNYSTKRLMEAGKERGHDMVIINHANCSVDIERNKPGILYKGQKIENIDDFDVDDIVVNDYLSNKTIKAEMAV